MERERTIYSVTADHVIPEYACKNLRVVVTNAGEYGFYADAPGYGMSKNYRTPEIAITTMLTDHACTNICIVRIEILVLTTDVENPHPDRRSKDWHKLPVIERGTRFIFNGSSLRRSDRRYGFVFNNEPLGKMILDRTIETEPQSVREHLEVAGCDWGEEEVLRILLKLGRITPDDFAAVAAVPDAC